VKQDAGGQGGTILVVDDEPRYVRWITVNLQGSGYRVLTAGDGQAALDAAARERPDLLLLDIGLPVLDGLEVCRRIREFSIVPIIMLMRAVLRRSRYGEGSTGDPLIRHDELTIDRAKCEVRRDGQIVALTPTEYKLLVQLARHPGRVQMPSELLEAVWGSEYREETQHVRLYVSRVRRKIEADPERPRHLLTKTGIGYLFAAPD
jgi:two-component system, OmpR family, KDP operon response regulator KdpE